MILQKMSDGTVRRKPQGDADYRSPEQKKKEQEIKKLNSLEKAMTAAIAKTTAGGPSSKFQAPLKKVRETLRKDRDKLLGK
jgi:hypothetical protein